MAHFHENNNAPGPAGSGAFFLGQYLVFLELPADNLLPIHQAQHISAFRQGSRANLEVGRFGW